MTPWTEYAAVVALGVGANSENLPVGLGYGMQLRKIGLASNLFIAVVTTGATLVPLAIGESLRGYMPERWPDIIGGLLLIFLGFFNVWFDRQRRPSFRVKSEPLQAAPISLGETLVLAGSLSLNNIGLGFAGGIADLGAGPVGISVAGFSVVLLWLGQHLGSAIGMRSHTLRWLLLDGNILIVAAGLAMVVAA
jgi:putative Mn2+ efflux pump MntP